jgi:hypothetical protein
VAAPGTTLEREGKKIMSAHAIEEVVKAPAQERSFKLFKRSPIMYWWPIWVAACLMAILSYWDGGYMVWVPPGTEAKRDWLVEIEPGRTQSREGLLLPAATGDKAPRLLSARAPHTGEPLDEPQQPNVRMARGRYLGFAFLFVMILVLLHSSILMRGYVSYLSALIGGVVLLIIPLIEAYFPSIGLWAWIKYVVYDVFHIYVSMQGYVFLGGFFLLVWLFALLVYDRRTYIMVTPGQFCVRQEIGQGELIYDVTLMMFERKRDDFFRHKILGLGFLDYLRRYLKLRFLPSGTGDLVFRLSGAQGQVINWPNVWDVERKLQTLRHTLAEREVVSGQE